MSDDLPERPRSRLNILPLDGLGVTELHAYISDLQVEIERTQAMIRRKQEHLGAADRIFGRPEQGG